MNKKNYEWIMKMLYLDPSPSKIKSSIALFGFCPDNNIVIPVPYIRIWNVTTKVFSFS